MIRRPQPGETEEDLLKFQSEFLASKDQGTQQSSVGVDLVKLTGLFIIYIFKVKYYIFIGLVIINIRVNIIYLITLN